jgi:hypothetical protein
MNATEMKVVLKEFGKTLNDKDKDEWWGTDKTVWDEMAKRFLQWYNSHHNKLAAKARRQQQPPA